MIRRCPAALLLLLCLFVLLLPAACGPAGEAAVAVERPVVLPLERGTRELLVTARINGQGPFPLVLDSGLAPSHLLAAEVAEGLGLRLGGFAVGASWGGISLARFARLDRLELGGIMFPRVRVVVMDLPDGVMRRAGRPDIAGLLGAPLFRAQAVTVDVPAGTVTLAPSGNGVEEGAVMLPLVEGPELPTIILHIDGQQVVVAVDTGATSDITLTDTAAERLGLPARYGRGRRAQVYSAAGLVDVTTRAVQQVDLAGITLAGVEVDVVETGPFGGGLLPGGLDGVVGLGLLTQFRFTLDMPAGHLALVPLAEQDTAVWDRLKRLSPGP